MKAWLRRYSWPVFNLLLGLALLVQLLLRWRREMEQQEAVRETFADLLAGAGLDVPTGLLINSPGPMIGTALLAGVLLGMALGWFRGRA